MLTTTHPAEVPVYGRLQLQPERGAGSTVAAPIARATLDAWLGQDSLLGQMP